MKTAHTLSLEMGALLIASLAFGADTSKVPDGLRSADELVPEWEQSYDSEAAEPNRPVACYSESSVGNVFLSWGYHPLYTQQMALSRCYATDSRTCYPLGCKWYNEPGEY